VKKRSDFLGEWLVIDRRGRHEREPASHDAADATYLDVSLSNAAAGPDLETRKSLITPTNSDIFNIPKRAAAVFDEFDQHGTLREPPACELRAELGKVRNSRLACERLLRRHRGQRSRAFARSRSEGPFRREFNPNGRSL
jgi:hypothetical protein